MTRALSIYMILGGLLFGGHSFLAESYPENGLADYLILAQTFLILLFIKSHLLTVFLSKKLNLLVGQVFLGFSVAKFIFAGMFIFLLKKTGEEPISKSFVAVYMFSYFTYLLVEVFLVLGEIQKDTPITSERN